LLGKLTPSHNLPAKKPPLRARRAVHLIPIHIRSCAVLSARMCVYVMWWWWFIVRVCSGSRQTRSQIATPNHAAKWILGKKNCAKSSYDANCLRLHAKDLITEHVKWKRFGGRLNDNQKSHHMQQLWYRELGLLFCFDNTKTLYVFKIVNRILLRF
jgi:hypothetical protein